MKNLIRFAAISAVLFCANVQLFAEGLSSGPAGMSADPSSAAPAAGGDAASAAGGGMSMLLPMIVIFGLMYFILIRPQQKEEKRRKQMIAEIKENDKVVTIGGIHGTVRRCGEKDLDVEIADGVVITVNRGSVQTNKQDDAKSGDSKSEK